MENFDLNAEVFKCDYMIVIYKDKILYGSTVPLNAMHSLNDFLICIGAEKILPTEGGFMAVSRKVD